ncbi:Spo0E family sporulation regulatory protein-aspartic acid phosphatase [Paenibacillus chartarius]|uniref:Spo0E family sporulation regulatory protein-aspartic acid phosphatase n=1 Tax=Paenibacillus chartarius TaxID=747481 RepID=A0ABV6DP80_9BACL
MSEQALDDELERLRSQLVALVSEAGGFAGLQVLQASCLLDEQIMAYYRANSKKAAVPGAKIA